MPDLEGKIVNAALGQEGVRISLSPSSRDDKRCSQWGLLPDTEIGFKVTNYEGKTLKVFEPSEKFQVISPAVAEQVKKCLARQLCRAQVRKPGLLSLDPGVKLAPQKQAE